MITTIGFFLFLFAAVKNIGWKETLLFIFLASGVGFLAEWLNINYGVVFGGYYQYNPNFGPQVFGVPWSVIGYWSVFIFGGIGMSNYFVKKYRSFWDGIFTLIIDIPLELVALKTKAWTWTDGVAPIGNYVGWFLVAFLVSLIFRRIHKKIFKSKFVVVLYLLIIILLVLSLV